MQGEAQLVAFVASARHAEALAFYRDVLGLALLADTPYAMVLQSGATTVRLQKVASLHAQPFTALGWEVADLDGEIDALAERGVRFERFPGFLQDVRATWAAPDGTRVAWFKDPDGNLLSLSESPR